MTPSGQDFSRGPCVFASWLCVCRGEHWEVCSFNVCFFVQVDQSCIYNSCVFVKVALAQCPAVLPVKGRNKPTNDEIATFCKGRSESPFFL